MINFLNISLTPFWKRLTWISFYILFGVLSSSVVVHYFLPRPNPVRDTTTLSTLGVLSPVDEIELFSGVVSSDFVFPESKPDDKSAEIEALASIRLAQDMVHDGKFDKAHKLFEHALALAPKHPDVLNIYGEFVESNKQDLIEADHLYQRALIYCPDHTPAHKNKGRVASLVEEIDRATLKRIDQKRDRLAAIPDSDPALRKVKKEAYFQHIYHTAGIEGNTLTLTQTRAIVESKIAIGGKSIIEHNEVLGLDAALKYINTSLINRIGAITVNDIKEIHRRVLGYVDPIEGGSFRRTQVFVGDHIPPAPTDIEPLMHEFETWLNSWESISLHPVRYAALAHYKLVHIHPFHDGNGRTSRLLMNLILMQAGYPPVIILKQDRYRYYKMLGLANEGDVRPFIRFIGECTERTLDLFLWSTSEYSTSKLPALGLNRDMVIPKSSDLN